MSRMLKILSVSQKKGRNAKLEIIVFEFILKIPLLTFFFNEDSAHFFAPVIIPDLNALQLALCCQFKGKFLIKDIVALTYLRKTILIEESKVEAG